MKDLSATFVCKGGKIFLWSGIRVLLKGTEEKGEEDEGLPVWSERLEPYRTQEFRAVTDSDSASLLVYKRGESIPVKKIPFEELYSVYSHEHIVASVGYLFPVLYYQRDNEEHLNSLIKTIARADEGHDPGWYDESSFLRVDLKYAGKKVYCVAEGARDETRRVYDAETGDSIPFEICCPLSFEKWGKQPPNSDEGHWDFDDVIG
jgi:hypothetical protein